MKRLFHNALSLFVLLCMAMAPLGCDSNNSQPSGDSFDIMARMVENSFSAFAGVAGEIVLQGISKDQPTYACQGGGEVDWMPTSNTNEWVLDFNDCNDLNGNINLGLNWTITPDFRFDLTLDGQLTEECTINLINFQESVVSDLETETSTISLNGSISSNCNGESFSCDFSNKVLTQGNEDTIIESACGIG